MNPADAAWQTRSLLPGILGERNGSGRGIHHAVWMLEHVWNTYGNRRLTRKESDKAMRWLGYAQGVLVQTDTCTLGQMMEINKNASY